MWGYFRVSSMFSIDIFIIILLTWGNESVPI